MTAELLSAFAGIALSLAFSYIPGLSDWFGVLDPTRKRLIMAVVLLIFTIVIFVLSCTNVVAMATCDQPAEG